MWNANSFVQGLKFGSLCSSPKTVTLTNALINKVCMYFLVPLSTHKYFRLEKKNELLLREINQIEQLINIFK